MTRVLCLGGLIAAAVVSFTSCSTYDPLKVQSLRTIPAIENGRLKATFLGNSSVLITDGRTKLLVDGFFSRPGPLRTLFGKIAPDQKVICRDLNAAGIKKLDAVLVGHSHHDHALDSATVAGWTGATLMGSESYKHIHDGYRCRTGEKPLLIVVPEGGIQKRFGQFVVTFVPSDHVSSHSPMQQKVEGRIKETVVTPAPYTEFKCDPVFAIHLAHPEGNVLVTTTAGAKLGALDRYRTDTVFLGVGLLAKESPSQQEFYWRETVETVDPKLVIPVHWDQFTRKLSDGLKPQSSPFDDVRGAMDLVREKAGDRRQVYVMDVFETITLPGNR